MSNNEPLKYHTKERVEYIDALHGLTIRSRYMQTNTNAS